MSLGDTLGLHGLSWADVVALCSHFMLLSVLAVGGAITTAPDMQRYMVGQQHWLDDLQFNAAIAIAQAAPGPNILFVALLGWNTAGLAGLLATMGGIMLPSSILALAAGRYAQRRADSLAVRAFTAGMAPLTMGLLLSTGWVLAAPTRGTPGAVALVAATVLAGVRTRLGPLWLMAGGAVVGMLGLA